MRLTGWSMLKNLSLVDPLQQLQISVFNKIKTDCELYLCVCIERHPVITCQANDFEQDICSTLLTIENENSNKSNYEFEKNIDLKRLNLLSKGNIEFNLCNSSKLSIHDFKEHCQNELKNLKISSRSTDKISDKTNNYSKRRLQESLFFVTKRIESNKENWSLPIDIIHNNETIKQAAKRILNYNCGDNFNVFFYGSTPIGCMKYNILDNDVKQANVRSSKILFLLAKYVNGHVHKNTEYQWLNMHELQFILPKSVYVQVSSFFHIFQ